MTNDGHIFLLIFLYVAWLSVPLSFDFGNVSLGLITGETNDSAVISILPQPMAETKRQVLYHSLFLDDYLDCSQGTYIIVRDLSIF